MKSSKLLLIALCCLLAAPMPSHAGDLNLNGYHETFSETFRGLLNVTAWGPSRWIAHTPWNGDFGDAQFADPRPDFPFRTGLNGLTITARKNALGKWQSGLLSSVDAKGRGFAQAGGYFEARMKMPPGPGTWPAFWLVANGDSEYKAEIDVIEYYGKFTDSYHVNSHLWPKAQGAAALGDGKQISVPTDSLTQSFHTYGVEILDKEMVFYLDRHEVARLAATAPAYKQPMSLLVNLALGSGWPIDQTPNPSVLQVDYIKAYSRK